MIKYKLIILAIIALLIGFLAGYTLKKTPEVEVPTVANVTVVANSGANEAKDYGKPALVYFYADACSSCNKFKPTWKLVKQKYKDKFNFVEIDVDKAESAPLCMEFMVNVIPSLHIEDAPFRNRAYINPMEYHFPPRLMDDLNRYLEMREILKKPEMLKPLNVNGMPEALLSNDKKIVQYEMLFQRLDKKEK